MISELEIPQPKSWITPTGSGAGSGSGAPQRLAVFTGPILQPGDPIYRGAQIPLRFYRITAWLGDQRLAASGYVLDQTELVRRILTAPDRKPRTTPPLGAYKTFQVPIADIAAAAALTMPDLVDADVLQLAGVHSAAKQPDTSGWTTLRSHADIVLA